MHILKSIFLFSCLIFSAHLHSQSRIKQPNIILVFIDDMGYGDVSIHNPNIDYTPNFQYLAEHGVVMNHFYVSESVCTASRSSLLTGCYANRVGMGGAIDHTSTNGLNPAETTIPEMLKTKGYRTAAFGKWHLGFQQPFLPTNQGFDEFFGIPYSNDMWPHHPQSPGYYPPLPLYQNGTVIDTVREQSWFTNTFTEKAIAFISQKKQQPFFLYLAHPLPHVPLFVSEKFKNSTGNGLYADVIHEIDYSIGKLLEALRKHNLEENTLLIVTSDNGPWLAYGNHSGQTAGLREGKGTSWEGGLRVPFIAYWKNVLPENQRVNQHAMTIDILPTLASITGASLPEKKIDGINIWPLLSGSDQQIPDRPLFFYYNRNDLEAMRWQQWKLYFPHTYRTMEGQPQGSGGQPGQYKYIHMEKPELYNLSSDPYERKNVYDSFPQVADSLRKISEGIRHELGDDLTNQNGFAIRPAGSFRSLNQPAIPFWDTTLPFESRAEDLVKRLTLEEKVGQLMHRAPAINRMGIPAYNWWNEALHGVARTKYATTVFPQAIGMAATWDTEAVKAAGQIVAKEGRAIYNTTLRQGNAGYPYTGLTYWSPNINIFRDPRWGRGQETYGEDPLLTATIGSAYVSGIQGSHSKYLSAAACAKHFAVHSGPEPTRHSFDARPSKYDLWDTYLPAFETLVTKANVQGVMCAYNAYKGQPCCANDILMKDILRKKWGFSGYVTSDCWGLDDFISFHKTHASKSQAAIDALIHSTDVECGQDIFLTLKDAVNSGLVAESSIDTALMRLFLLRLKLGMFDPSDKVPGGSLDTSALCHPDHQAHALEMARKSIVLLKNEKNTLPLSKNMKKVVVCGPNADNHLSILGNYTGLPAGPVTLFEGLRQKLDSSCEVVFDAVVGFTSDTTSRLDDMQSVWRTKDGNSGVRVSFFNNDKLEGEPVTESVVNEIDAYWLEGQSPAPGVSNFYYSCRFEATLSPDRDTTLYFIVDGDDGFRLWMDDSLYIDEWKQHKGGEKSFTWTGKAGKVYHIVLEHRQGEGPAHIRLRSGRKEVTNMAQWLKKHKDADVIIFAGGISPQLEGEELKVSTPGFLGGDRTSMSLPESQKKCVQALSKTGKKVVFVLMTGSALAVPEEDSSIPAIVNGWYGGQAAGTALAEVLLGEYNPAGRLPVTFYTSDADLPPFSDYSMEGRTYRYFDGESLYPFGYGLSYTTFAYSNMQLPEKVNEGDSVRLKVWVTNTGNIPGDEVVQCYVSHSAKDIKAPIRALKAFQRVHLQAGERREVSFVLPSKDFRLTNEEGQKIWKPGPIQISLGGGQPGVSRPTSGNVITKTCRVE